MNQRDEDQLYEMEDELVARLRQEEENVLYSLRDRLFYEDRGIRDRIQVVL